MNRFFKALMLLNLEILLIFPSCLQQKVDIGTKSVDQYWQETGLTSSELETLLADQSCFSSQQSYLACVNSVQMMADRYSLALTEQGDFRKMNPSEIIQRVSEKTELTKWLPAFERAEVSPGFSFLELWNVLNTKYIKASEKAAVIATGINGFLSIYKDPHTYIMPLAMYEEVVSKGESKNTNVGFVARRIQDDLVIRKVYEGSPAEMAGLRKGDRIVEINGERIVEILPSRINDLLKMKYAERIGFKIERKTGLKIHQRFIDLKRAEANYPSVAAKLVENGSRLGLLTIHKFSKNICQQTKVKLQDLIEQNIQGIMLDLRDNPGGQVDEAACVANLFLPKGLPIFETRYLDMTRPADKYLTVEEPMYQGPLTILINSGSASASEIVAGVLRDQNRAKLVGEKTFGKGTFQDGRIWGPNTKIALFQTEGLYYFASGWTPQLVGLQPDLPVNFNNAENSREEELFFNPIMPLDNWNGPQTLSWLAERECGMEMALSEEDPQLSKAQSVLHCGARRGQNGSL